MKNERSSKVVVIGAGLGGSLMAIYLAKQGFNVEVYEYRDDMRNAALVGGRSINMTLAERGMHALEEVGIRDKLAPFTVPLKGRMIHEVDGRQRFQPYGKSDNEVIYAIKRKELNIALVDFAETFPNIKVFFNKRCVRADKETGSVNVWDSLTSKGTDVSSDFIIGADGTFSTVRQQMYKGERADYQQEFLDRGYKELTIPPGPDGSFRMEKNALHIWPRGDRLLIAIPNYDGSFTCTCILPFEGEESFQSLNTQSQVLSFFEANFADAISLVPKLTEDFLHHPPCGFLTVLTRPWYYKGRVLLLGDACHTVLPFYGQGMNAAFEDCSVLNSCLLRSKGDWEASFKEFQSLRKPNTDALAQLSKENFIELRDKVRSPVFIARKKVEGTLSYVFPKFWVPLYTSITHTTTPYAEAVKAFKKQERRARWLGFDVAMLIVATAIYLTGLTRKLWLARPVKSGGEFFLKNRWRRFSQQRFSRKVGLPPGRLITYEPESNR